MDRQIQTRLFCVLLPVLIFALLFSSGNQVAHALDQGGVTLVAYAGFGGYCKENRWMPVQVVVENKGADLTARIQVSNSNGNGAQFVYAEDISLPTTSRKELFLYLYPQSYTQKITVSLLAGGNTLVTTALNVTCLTAENQLFGLLTDNPAAFSSLAETAPLTGFVRVAQLQLANLPDQSQGWESLDALVVSGLDMSAMTDAQRAAMRSWLAQGGKLLVVGGPKWQSVAGGLDEFLPLGLNATSSVSSLSGMSSYFRVAGTLQGETILATGTDRPGAQVLIRQDGIPLLVQKQVGFGSVFYLAADPGLQPLSTWAGMKDVYSHLLGDRSLQPAWMASVWNPYYANQALSALPALSLPSAMYVFCLLGLYILIVGPLNYFVLRRFKRQELAWISIPILVVLFTLSTYFVGTLIRGSRPTLNRLAIVQGWEGVDRDQVHALVGIFSPGREKYTLQAGTPFLFYVPDNNQALQASQDWLSLKQDPNTVLPDVQVESGAVKAAALNGATPAIPFTSKLGIDVSGTDPVLSGTITNTGKYALKDAKLVTPGDFKELGTFAPGETKQIRLSLVTGSGGADFYSSPLISPSPYSNPIRTDAEDTTARRSNLMGVVQSGSAGSTYQNSPQNRGNWGIYLIGWVDDALLPVSLQGNPTDNIDTTLYSLMLSPMVKFEPGALKVPPSLFIWESSDPNLTPYSSYDQVIPQGGFALSFRSAFPLRYSTVKSLQLNLTSSGGFGQSGPLSGVGVALWNWDNAAWENLQNPVWGNNPVPDPTRYVGPGAEIRLRLNDQQTANQAPAQFEDASFTLVVQP